MRLREVFRKVALPAAMVGVVVGANVGIDKATEQQLDVTIQNTGSSLMHRGEGFGFTKKTYETDKGTFTNTISVFQGKFSSDRAKLDRELEVGKTYTVTTVGVSIPLVGKYPNIIKATPKPPGK